MDVGVEGTRTAGPRDRGSGATDGGRLRYRRVPTVLRAEGFRFFFFSNEGKEPPHIHVERGDGHAKFWLQPVSLAVPKDLKSLELKRVKLLVIEHRLFFLEEWREYFGS